MRAADYPGREHPMVILARVLAEMGIAGTIAADGDGYPEILGYAGPTLGEGRAPRSSRSRRLSSS